LKQLANHDFPMTQSPEDYLVAFNRLLQQTGRKSLKPIPAEVFLGLVRGESYETIADRVGRKVVTMRGIATGFWDVLSEMFNIKVNKYNYLKYLEDHANTFCPVTTDAEPALSEALLEIIPSPEKFYGRAGEIFDLRQQIERPGITMILGATGIGKTALVGSTLSSLPNKRVVWQTIAAESSLSDIWQAIAPEDDQPDAAALVPALMQKLSESPYIIVLDQAENLLNPPQSSATLALSAYAKSHQGYGQLLKAVCEKSSQTAVVLMSQQVFPDLQRYNKAGRAVVIRHLEGLSDTDAMGLLQSYDVPNKKDWPVLVAAYHGNPRLLRQAIPMLEYYGGDIREFLDHSLFITNDSKQSLRQLISRLTPSEQKILMFLRNQPRSFPELLDALRVDLPDLTRTDLLQLIESLLSMAMLEKSGTPPKLSLALAIVPLLNDAVEGVA
jgi:AAA domain